MLASAMTSTSLPPRTRLSGDDLRLLRQARRVTATSMVPYYGASRNAITNLEATAHPRPGTVARYMRALTAAEAERDGQ